MRSDVMLHMRKSARADEAAARAPSSGKAKRRLIVAVSRQAAAYSEAGARCQLWRLWTLSAKAFKAGAEAGMKLNWGLIGGGEGSQIGPAHRLGARLDGLYEF